MAVDILIDDEIPMVYHIKACPKLVLEQKCSASYQAY